MTQEEFESAVRARWPEADNCPWLMAAAVCLGDDVLTIEWDSISKWYVSTRKHRAFADTLERAVLALEVEIVKEVQDWVADANTLLSITSPGASLDLVMTRPEVSK